MKKKLIQCIITGFLLTAAVSGIACTKQTDSGNKAETSDVSGSEKEPDTSASEDKSGAEELEDFSMPVKKEVKLDGAKFENVALAAEQLGFDFQAPESFSNGYEFIWLTVNGETSMTLTYAKDGLQVELTVTPEELGGATRESDAAGRLEDVTVEGISVKGFLYVHFMVPNVENWKDYFSEEDLKLLDAGIGSANTSGEETELERTDCYTFWWQQAENEWFCLENSVLYNVPVEDMKLMVEEWIKMNPQTNAEEAGE